MASSAERFRLVEGTVPATGDISNTLTNTNNTSANRFLLINQYASNFESVGITNQNSSTFLNPLTTGLSNQTPIHKQSVAAPLDLSNLSIRRGVPILSVASPQETIAKERAGVETLTFPEDLSNDTASAYVKLEFISYDRFAAFGTGTLTPKRILYLPLPENYNQTFSVSYNQSDQGFFGDIMQSEVGQKTIKEAADAVQRAVAEGGVLNAITGSITGVANTVSAINIDDAMKLGSDLSLRAGYAMLDKFSDVGGAIAQQVAQKGIMNPHATIFFKGVGLREFTWTWRLVPRSAKEAESIRAILKALRKSILPKTQSNILKYPDMLQPTVIGQQDLGKFKKCLVGGMTVNYSSEGAAAFFKDGHPSAISLTMSFQEVEIITSEDEDR